MRTLTLWVGTGLLIAVSSLAGAAQSSSPITGPSLGFLSDERGTTIWPLLGILGASVPGPALALPESIVQAAISPRHDYAIAVASENGEPVVVTLDLSNPAMVRLAGGRSNPGLIAMSPTGVSAALYEKQSGVLQVFSGLPAAPRLAFEFDAAALSGEVRDIAVSDDAKLALLNVGNETRTLWIVKGSTSALPVSVNQPSQMTFLANRPDALIADDAAQEVFVIEHLDQNPVRLPGIVLRNDGRRFSAVGASLDGRLIFVGQVGSEEITVTDLTTRTTAVVKCHCNSTGFFPLKGTSVFRLNGLPNRPITVLDASSLTPRTLIIPIDPDALARKGDNEQ